MDNGYYGGTGWLGIAQISVASGGTIVLGKYVIKNLTEPGMSTSQTPPLFLFP